uniref:CCT domain-containing protein n=1 Tax=Leersia perrieri TaxID=77586 RepID=A0A0D9XYB3_9ORYZ
MEICKKQQHQDEGILDSMYHNWGSSGSSSSSSSSSSRPFISSINGVIPDDAFLPVSSHQPPSSGHQPPEEEFLRAAVGRYSAEERRERIEKYRSKRNQRNFEKKITYACRKTLADSRPRVKGRFARNSVGDADCSQSTELAEAMSLPPPMGTTCNVDDDSNMPEWWPAMQEALARQEDEDEELLAAYLGVSSINLYSPRGNSTKDC